MFTQEEIIEMAGKVYGTTDFHKSALFHLEAFAKLVMDKAAEREREACAKVCDEISFRASDRHDAMTDDRNDEPILYMTGKESGSTSCADAIRARGNKE